MDKTMQNQDEMQDKELYALLEQALTEERLCVSEELIQKTLKRIEAQEFAEPVPIQKARKKNTWMRYSTVAAAAVLAVVLGIGMKDGFRMGRTANESMPEMAADGPEESMRYDYSSNNGVGILEDAVSRGKSVANSKAETTYSIPDELADMVAAEEPEIVYLEGTKVFMPAVWEKPEAENAAATESEAVAECWEFVNTGDDWVIELTQYLMEEETEASLLPEGGSYEYAVACDDGSRRSIGSEEPLLRIVKVQAGGEILWFLFGEELRVYKEN